MREHKLGKKRRSNRTVPSLSNAKRQNMWKKAKTIVSKSGGIYHYQMFPKFLANLFNDFKDRKLKIHDPKLSQDIEDSMKILNRIVQRKSLADLNQFYRGYAQADIDRLNAIIAKTTIKIRIDFVKLLNSDISGDDDGALYNLGKAAKKIKGMVKRTALPEFVLFPRPNGIDFNEETLYGVYSEYKSEKAMRHILTIGLIGYLQGLLTEKPLKIMPCEQCGRWFMFQRKSRQTCGDTCKSQKWNRSEKGKEKSRAKTQAYRDRKLGKI